MTSVFISYAHRDERLKNRVLVHLAALKQEGLIDVWHDRMLKPGDHLDNKIEAELAEADLVLLLISADFINSDYCTEKEMRRAFARAKAQQCIVAPVILKPCAWNRIPINDAGGRLGDFVATPRDGKPVTRWPEKDEALANVVTHVRGLITDETVLQAKKSRRPLPRRRRRKARRGPTVEVAKGVPREVRRDVWLADCHRKQTGLQLDQGKISAFMILLQKSSGKQHSTANSRSGRNAPIAICGRPFHKNTGRIIGFPIST